MKLFPGKHTCLKHFHESSDIARFNLFDSTRGVICRTPFHVQAVMLYDADEKATLKFTISVLALNAHASFSNSPYPSMDSLMVVKYCSICWLNRASNRVNAWNSKEIHLRLVYKLDKSANPAIRRSKWRT
jgi:hypothetical protein